MMTSYFDLNAFEWIIFILALVLIAGLLFLVPLSKALVRRKDLPAEASAEEKSE